MPRYIQHFNFPKDFHTPSLPAHFSRRGARHRQILFLAHVPEPTRRYGHNRSGLHLNTKFKCPGIYNTLIFLRISIHRLYRHISHAGELVMDKYYFWLTCQSLLDVMDTTDPASTSIQNLNTPVYTTL